MDHAPRSRTFGSACEVVLSALFGHAWRACVPLPPTRQPPLAAASSGAASSFPLTRMTTAPPQLVLLIQRTARVLGRPWLGAAQAMWVLESQLDLLVAALHSVTAPFRALPAPAPRMVAWDR
jgi:hypothetical protein